MVCEGQAEIEIAELTFLGCVDINPTVGVTATGTIDPTTGMFLKLLLPNKILTNYVEKESGILRPRHTRPNFKAHCSDHLTRPVALMVVTTFTELTRSLQILQMSFLQYCSMVPYFATMPTGCSLEATSINALLSSSLEIMSTLAMLLIVCNTTSQVRLLDMIRLPAESWKLWQRKAALNQTL
jgi:hypothetical protein